MRVFLMDLLCAVPYYVSALCAALRQEGVDAVFGSTSYYHDRACFRSRNLKPQPGLLDVVAYLPAPAALRRALKFVEIIINLAALAIRFLHRRPDVLHVQYLPLVPYGLPFEIWLIKLARRLGSRVVYTVHDRLPHDTGDRHRRRFARVYGMADALICHNQEARERLAREFSIPPAKLRLIPHGPLFTELGGGEAGQARRSLGLAEDECLVLWHGFIKPYKGVPFLLEAWAELAGRGAKARLAVVGTGEPPLLEEIRAQVARLGLAGSVRLDFRFVPNQELAAYFAAADILVYPYSDITTSGALLTGLTRRRAIVATALPAFRELLRDGENARLVEYGNVPQLSQALGSLIADPAERARLAQGAASTLSEEVSWAAIARRTKICYKSLLEPDERPQ